MGRAWHDLPGQVAPVPIELLPLGNSQQAARWWRTGGGHRISPTSQAPAWRGSRSRTALSPSPLRPVGWCPWSGTQCSPLVQWCCLVFQALAKSLWKKGHYSSWYPVGNWNKHGRHPVYRVARITANVQSLHVHRGVSSHVEADAYIEAEMVLSMWSVAGVCPLHIFLNPMFTFETLLPGSRVGSRRVNCSHKPSLSNIFHKKYN